VVEILRPVGIAIDTFNSFSDSRLSAVPLTSLYGFTFNSFSDSRSTQTLPASSLAARSLSIPSRIPVVEVAVSVDGETFRTFNSFSDSRFSPNGAVVARVLIFQFLLGFQVTARRAGNRRPNSFQFLLGFQLPRRQKLRLQEIERIFQFLLGFQYSDLQRINMHQPLTFNSFSDSRSVVAPHVTVISVYSFNSFSDSREKGKGSGEAGRMTFQFLLGFQ